MSQLEARRMGRRSPFVITLTKQDRRKLEARAGRPTAEQRQALRARIVLAAAGGEPNRRIAARLGVVPNTVCKWRKRFAEQDWQDWRTDHARVARPGSPGGDR